MLSALKELMALANLFTDNKSKKAQSKKDKFMADNKFNSQIDALIKGLQADGKKDIICEADGTNIVLPTDENYFLNGWEQYYNKEEKIQSISEYVVLVYMLRNKSQLEEFAHRRSEFKNFHRDIAEYLIGVWEENGWKDLMILEYEQYFQVENSADETYQELDSHSQSEIVESFHRLFQSETAS